MCGASIAYGLTDGGYNSNEITLTALGRRALAPTREDDDKAALQEAALKPRVFSAFFTKYDGAKIPPDNIAINVLTELGVPRAIAPRTLSLIKKNGNDVGFFRDIRGSIYVDLQSRGMPRSTSEDATGSEEELATLVEADSVNDQTEPGRLSPVIVQPNRRVFISHGKDRSFIEPLKKLLAFGELEPVVSVERSTASKPLPDKIMEDMRSCSAAIIHIDAERELTDSDGKSEIVLNQNVLIEIGAAMALYKKRFILLAPKNVTLPSNLSGLYIVKYSGDSLDGSATIDLMSAINDMKSAK